MEKLVLKSKAEFDANKGRAVNIIDLENAIIDFDLTLNNAYGSVKFLNCEFKKGFQITRGEGRFEFDNCDFQNINLNNATFKKKVRFRNCNFLGKTNFRNTVFEDLADFWSSTFSERVIFYKTDFIGTAVFSSATFKKNILFTYSLIDKTLIMRGTKLEKGLDLSLSIGSGDFAFFDLTLNYFDFVRPSGDEEYEEMVSHKGEIPEKNRRETFRFLKKYHLDNNNSYEFQEYQLKESRALRKEVWNKVKSGNDFWVNVGNYTILLLNRASNNHGNSFGRGLLFTVLIGLLFFYFSVLATEKISFAWSLSGVKQTASFFWQFLLPTHKMSYVDHLDPNGCYYFWDFVGRIFVSYGIYQTIQAFRKLK